MLFAAFAFGQEGLPKLTIFFSPSCHECLKAKNEVIPDIEKEFKGKISIEYRDITGTENYKSMLSLKEKYKSDIEIILPVFYFEGRFLNAKSAAKDNLRDFITQSLSRSGQGQAPAHIDLVERFKSFRPLVILGAGLIDGINPCAFTVIVFFMSFLAVQGYKKRQLSIIGLSFIFAVFLTYLLMGIGIFGFLYRIKGFWQVSKAFNLLIGIFSMVMGIFALYDFFVFKKSGQTEGLVLQLPRAVKNRIHAVIGLHYRQPQAQNDARINKGFLMLVASALATGFIVSILEAVCTGQTYLPTIAFVLKVSHLRLQAFSYLLLYNLMFIVPLFVIFLFALLGVTSAGFSNLMKRHLGSIKIAMAVLFFVLGLLLVWRA